MSINSIIDSAKGFASRTSWKIQKHAPEILLVTGIVSTVAAVVSAFKAAPKAKEVIEEHKAQMEIVHKSADTEKEKKSTITVYAKSGCKLGKVLLPVIGFTGGSIVSQICGYKVLSRRFAEASAAYALLAAKFKKYRKNVANRMGETEERVIYHDLQPKEVTTTTTNENGEEVTKTETVFIADDDDYTGIFSRVNEDGIVNTKWEPSTEQNLTWLMMQQDYWDKVLRCRKGKPVTLNEVRAWLDLPVTQKGQAVGWVYDPDNPEHNGDNFISFGLDPLIRAYRNGEEMPDDNSFVLDFNVDGEILYAF